MKTGKELKDSSIGIRVRALILIGILVILAGCTEVRLPQGPQANPIGSDGLILKMADLPPGSEYHFVFRESIAAILVNTDGKLKAYINTCGKGGFVLLEGDTLNCQGNEATFDPKTGAVLQDSDESPLRIIPIVIKDGAVYVDERQTKSIPPIPTDEPPVPTDEPPVPRDEPPVPTDEPPTPTAQSSPTDTSQSERTSPNPPLSREQMETYPDFATALDPVCAEPLVEEGTCSEGMAFIRQCGGYCIDKYETSKGEDGAAESKEGVRPWINITFYEAKEACETAGKRLCKDFEWMSACNLGGDRYYLTEEEDNETFGCNTNDKCPFPECHIGGERMLWCPERNCPGGTNPKCRSAEGVYDMIGNVLEWTDAQVPSDEWGENVGNSIASILGEDEDKYGQDGFHRHHALTIIGTPFLRGGIHTQSESMSPWAGCFTLHLHRQPTEAEPYAGFRCCSDPE